ncbi:MAG TPA: hypothetical protein VEC08_01145 [Nitrososphaerales archaeon]|nr:hypothetical protein [Nitrososphaerales archaeon]
MCEKCHAGQLQEYTKMIGRGDKTVTIKGTKCDMCGFTDVQNDEDIWSAVGL